MLTRRKFLKTSLALGALSLVGDSITGCQVPQQMSPTRRLRYQEPWRNNGENAPVHTAMHAGYYEEEGISPFVLEPGGPGIPGLDLVIKGNDDLLIGCSASMTGLVPRVAEGVPLVAVGAMLQFHPYAYVGLREVFGKEDLEPEDLRGRTIGTQTGGEIYLQALLERNGMTMDDVTVRHIAGENPADLLSDQVDLATYWIINQPINLTLMGVEWSKLLFAEWGVPIYGDVVYTTRDRLETHPDLVRGFLRATARGMKKMYEDVEFAHAATMKYGDGIDTAEKLTIRLDMQNEMSRSAFTDEHGYMWMDSDNVQTGIDWFVDSGQVKNRITADQIMTNDFLPGHV